MKFYKCCRLDHFILWCKCKIFSSRVTNIRELKNTIKYLFNYKNDFSKFLCLVCIYIYIYTPHTLSFKVILSYLREQRNKRLRLVFEMQMTVMFFCFSLWENIGKIFKFKLYLKKLVVFSFFCKNFFCFFFTFLFI